MEFEEIPDYDYIIGMIKAYLRDKYNVFDENEIIFEWNVRIFEPKHYLLSSHLNSIFVIFILLIGSTLLFEGLVLHFRVIRIKDVLKLKF